MAVLELLRGVRAASSVHGVTIDAAKVTGLLQALLGKSLPQMCVGVADLQMRFEDGQTVQLEGPVVVAHGMRVQPYSLDGLAHLLPLLNGEVTGASADGSGTLTLTLGDTTVRCEADERSEAWNYNGLNGARVVAMPGGDLAIWATRRP